MSKGYVKIAMAIIFMLVTYVIVNYVIAQQLNKEISISDKVSKFYRMVNAVEAARAHSTQALGLSVKAAKNDLGIQDVNQIDENLKNKFIDKVNEYFHPSLSYSNVDVNIKVVSVDVQNSRVVSILNLEIVSLDSEVRGSIINGDIKVWSEI
ncbi:MAG: hypothetical protein NTW30_01555 [Candidatus Aenigmarchaeota archaeon]|nr:hypothetical protein [Candidatus Aenigmarchaeota archaeon]